MRKILRILLVICLVAVSIQGSIFASGNSELLVHEQLGKGNSEYVLGEVLIKFKNDKVPFHVFNVGKGNVEARIKALSKNPNVEFVEPNFIAHAYVNDTYYDYQWNLRGRDEGGINAELAWTVTTGKPEVIVAVLDTGIAYKNFRNYSIAPDLTGTSFVPGYDFINNDTKPNDDEGHGTHVAGTIAQTTNNNLGAAGVAHDVSLMPVKVLNAQGSGSYASIANGIYFAADNGADVINMSLGGSSESQVLLDALQYAYEEKGVTIVAATGNDSGPVGYPAAYNSYVIAVGATRYDMDLSYYSNYGSEVDVVAPGGDVTVDQNADGYGDGILQNTFGSNPNDFGYYFYQGTSMATPHVAAAAALLISKDDTMTPDQVQRALQDTAYDLGANGRDDFYGYGLIDVYAALSWTDDTGGSNNPPTADDKNVVTDEDTNVPVTLSGNDPDGHPITYSVTSGPSNGSLTGTAPALTYSPDANYNGGDSFKYVVNDGKVNSAEATVSITINAVNDPPTANDQTTSTYVDTSLPITVTGDDVDGNSLTYSGDTASANGGTITWNVDNTNNNVTYMPKAGYVGTDSFEFVVNDGTLDSLPATVTIDVLAEPVQGEITYTKVVTVTTGTAGKQEYVTATAAITVYENGVKLPEAYVEGNWVGGIDTTLGSGTTKRNGTVSIKLERTRLPNGTIADPGFYVDFVDIVVNGSPATELE